MMKLSDSIRRFVCEKYIDPAREKGNKELTIRVGDIHDKMGLISRMPAVCLALKSKKMEETGNVRLVNIKAPPSGEGSNLFITYKILTPVLSTEKSLTEVIQTMRGRQKEIIEPLVSLVSQKLSSFKGRAEKLSGDRERITSFVKKVLEKLKENNVALNQIFNDVNTLIRLVSSWANGSYKSIPVSTIISIIAALIYLVSPVDIIPDFIPGIGYIDDIAVILFVIKSIKTDLNNFLQWENDKGNEIRIYMTHCSAKKDAVLKNSSKKVTPDKLYTASPTQRFMHRCIEKNVKWAILSDLYGIWFPDVENEWYEKDPDSVTEEEFKKLVNDFNQKLQGHKEIWFYCNPGRFHPLYKRLLQETKLTGRVKQFTHISEII